MKYTRTSIEGVVIVDLAPIGDERGFFARVFCGEEFGREGLATGWVQVNNSLSREPLTLRGMHYQLPPRREAKLVRVVSGCLYDVALDLRPDSPTFGQSFGTELSAENRRMLHVPEGCAHGFLTLEPDTEVFYFTSAPYAPELERGVRWDDPRFGIEWPATPRVLSNKDRTLPDYEGPEG